LPSLQVHYLGASKSKLLPWRYLCMSLFLFFSLLLPLFHDQLLIWPFLCLSLITFLLLKLWSEVLPGGWGGGPWDKGPWTRLKNIREGLVYNFLGLIWLESDIWVFRMLLLHENCCLMGKVTFNICLVILWSMHTPSLARSIYVI
jgi:hypothetical protein